MKKTYRFFTVMLLALAAQAFFTSCNSDVGSDSEATHYTVTFYKNYEGADPASFSFYCEEGKFSTLPTQLRKGYKFLGWAKTADATAPEYAGGGSVKVESDIAFYALWQKVESFKVTFDAGFIKDGDSAAETKIQTVNVSSPSEKFTLDKNPFAKAGSTFLGWNKYASGTYAQYRDKDSISIYADTTLYAVWKDDIVLTFNANGGVGSNFTKNAAYDTASSSYKFTVPENTFTKTGYVFIGWGNSASSKDASYKAGESASASESKTLYAIWAKESVPVRFDPNTENGGSGTPFTENLLQNTTAMKYGLPFGDNEVYSASRVTPASLASFVIPFDRAIAPITLITSAASPASRAADKYAVTSSGVIIFSAISHFVIFIYIPFAILCAFTMSSFCVALSPPHKRMTILLCSFL